MRPKKHQTTGSNDLFRARLDQIINLKHELAQLADKIDWDWIDGEVAPLYSDKGRPGIETRFAIGLLLLKHIYGLSDEGVCERWVYDPYFQHFTGEEFFQHAFPHERSDLSHWRKRLGDKLELLLAESLRVGPLWDATLVSCKSFGIVLRDCRAVDQQVDLLREMYRRVVRVKPDTPALKLGNRLWSC